MKKDCLITVITMAVLTLLLVIFYLIALANFDLSSPPTRITSYIKNPHCHIEIYSLGGSTAISCIQIRKVDTITKEEYVLENYENYSILMGYCLDEDVMTVLLKKGYYPSCEIKCDTFHLNINDVKWKVK